MRQNYFHDYYNDTKMTIVKVCMMIREDIHIYSGKSLPKAMSISGSEILRRKAAAETENEKLPSVKVLESVS